MIQIANPIRSSVHRLSQIPWVFDGLRWILEAGYSRHHDLLHRHFFQSPLRVMDCGCGTGIYSRFFSPHSYVGIDVSPIYIERARAKFPQHSFHVMDATKLEFPDNSFTAVIVSGVVHHLDVSTTRDVLREISRVLQPNGTLLLWEDVPTQHSLNWVGRIIHSLDVGEHIRPEDEYAELLLEHFCIESVESFRSGFMDYAAFRSRNRMKSMIFPNATKQDEVPIFPSNHSSYEETKANSNFDRAVLHRTRD
jgi:ubiquinone/menaquinone biosynthesis C-methylase UbiE